MESSSGTNQQCLENDFSDNTVKVFNEPKETIAPRNNSLGSKAQKV